MEEIEKIRKQLEALINEDATKEQIEGLALINENLNAIESKSSKQKDEYTELLKDYATVVKHQAFTVNNKNAVDETHKEFSFENFVESYVANKK